MTTDRPNVLWIFVDEFAAYAMSCAGDPNISTPNLDRLANEGVRFTQAYRNTPICVPARACVYTGQFITTHGTKANHYPLIPKAPQTAQVMSEAGYRTSHHGKWHLSGGTVNQHFVSPFFRPGWQEWIGWECMHGKAGNGTHYNTSYSDSDRNIKAKQIDKFQADWLTDRTVESLENRDTDQPWFHVISIETPHPPCDLPNLSLPHWEQFKNKKITFRPNVPEHMRNDEEFRDFVRGYYSHIANIDDNIGRILDTLEKTDQLERTIVVFFADHGDHQGAHGRRAGKSTPTEESAKIPFIIRLPSCIKIQKRGYASETLISLVDLMPTTLGLCGIPVPETCEGIDLSSAVKGEAETGQESIYMQFENSYLAETNPKTVWRAVRKGPWMYSENSEQGSEYLFNLKDDPYELNNLVSDPAHGDILKELHTDMKNKAAAIGDDYFEKSQ